MAPGEMTTGSEALQSNAPKTEVVNVRFLRSDVALVGGVDHISDEREPAGYRTAVLADRRDAASSAARLLMVSRGV
jgi:hypothetical protein